MEIKLPQVFTQTFEGIGSSTLYLSMIYIGMLVADFRPEKKDFGLDVLMLNFNKLIFAPLLVFGVLILLTRYAGINLSFAAVGALVMQAAMPCMAIMVILARNYGSDENAAMVNVFSTTIAGLLTMPFIFWLLTILW
jgi:predicted permease